MPLKFRGFSALWLLGLLLLIAMPSDAQTEEQLRQRMARARAFIATRNYNAAVYELDGIRKDTKDESVQNVALTMLMNVYLEQGDYRRAQDLLTDTYNNQRITKKVSQTYYSVAAQVVRGAKGQSERYRSLGLSVKDPNLPVEAVADVEKMRETLEMIVKQSEDLSDANKQAQDSFSLLEEASTARSNMARDDFDASRWKNKIVDVRERMASSRSTVVNVVEDPNAAAVAVNRTPTPAPMPTIVPIAASRPSPTPKKQDKPKEVKPEKAIQTEPARSADTSIQNAGQLAKNDPKPAEKPPVVTEKPIEKPQPKIENTAEKPIDKPAAKVAEPPKDVVAEVKRDPLFSATSSGNNVAAGSNEAPAPQKTAEPGGEEKPPAMEKPQPQPTPEVAKPLDNQIVNDPLKVGSMKEYAVRTIQPTYPAIARNMRMTGVVKIDFLVNEAGEVAQIEGSTGPDLLKRAAIDALKKWKFKPFDRDGQPAKASGFVTFNFSL